MSEFAEGYAVGQGQNNNNCGYGYGMGGYGWGEWIWIIVLFALWQNGGFGFGGFGGGCGRGNCATQADLAAGFNNSAVLSGLNDIKLGQANAINYNNQGFNGLNTAVLQGFNGVERGFCDISHQLSDCCCTTQRAIDGVRYDMAKESCDTRHAIYNSTRDIIDNANANNRALLDFLVQDKLATKDARIAQLENKLSQSEQNAVLMAAMDANVATILRRTGAECPSPAYIVNAPTPVTFPVNGCGQAVYGGYNGYNNGCGCGCGCA
jgi:hypothetical protein